LYDPVEKGLISVDDPVSKFFPELSDKVATAIKDDVTFESRPVKTSMTVAHLMSHSSGISALVGKARRAEMEKKSAAASSGPTPPAGPGQRTGGAGTAKYLKDEMIALSKSPLGFDPGSEWSYHISTNMLAYMVEPISGKVLRECVKSTVLDPLGTRSRSF
jgi:CubicO group peptidase (beta-lactamase class C family)